MLTLENFKKLWLSEATIDALRKKWFERPSEIQEKTIPLLLKWEKDIIGQAQTGTGKTAAFWLPLIEKIDEKSKWVQALVLCPTRELAIQVAEEIISFKWEKNLKLATIYWWQSYTNELSKLKKWAHIVVWTPWRIMDHLWKWTLKIDNIKYFVLDEADEMLNMWFKEDIESILETTPNDKKMLFFSATMPSEIMRIAKKFMKDYDIVSVKKNTTTNELIEQIYFQVNRNDKFDALCRIIDIEDNFFWIVFCRTKNDVDEVVLHLQNRWYDADWLHWDVKQSTREKIISKLKNWTINILIATDVAARWIDINNLTHVINYSLPDWSESYTHRIWRTWRAWKTWTAITFVTPSEHRRLFFIQKDTKAEIQKWKLPSIKDILKVKRNRIIESVENAVGKEDLSSVYDIAEKVLEWKNAKDVVSALIKNFYKNELENASYKEIQEAWEQQSSWSFGSKNSCRLFIAKWKSDWMNPIKIIELVNDYVKIESRKIDDIAVMENFTFVTMPLKEAEAILNKMKKEEWQPLIERAQEKPWRAWRKSWWERRWWAWGWRKREEKWIYNRNKGKFRKR